MSNLPSISPSKQRAEGEHNPSQIGGKICWTTSQDDGLQGLSGLQIVDDSPTTTACIIQGKTYNENILKQFFFNWAEKLSLVGSIKISEGDYEGDELGIEGTIEGPAQALETFIEEAEKLQEHTLIRVKRFQGIKKTSYTDFQLNTTRLKQDYTEVSGVESPLSKDLDHIEEFPHSLRKIDRLQSNDSNAVFICYCKGNGLHYVTKELIIKGARSAKSSNETRRLLHEPNILENIHGFSESDAKFPSPKPGIIPPPCVIRDGVRVSLIYPMYAMDLYIGVETYAVKFRREGVTESIATLWFSQLLKTLQILESKNVVHHDIKLENVLLDEKGNVALSDFEMSAARSDITGKYPPCVVGTPLYMAPEILCGEDYDTSANLWSLGILAFEMVSCTNPWDIDVMNTSPDRIKYKIINVLPKKSPIMSDLYFDLISRILKDSKSRISLEEALHHPLFKSIDFDNLYQEKHLIPEMEAFVRTVSEQNLHLIYTRTENADTGTVSSGTASSSSPSHPGRSMISAGVESDFDIDAFAMGKVKKISLSHSSNTAASLPSSPSQSSTSIARSTPTTSSKHLAKQLEGKKTSKVPYRPPSINKPSFNNRPARVIA